MSGDELRVATAHLNDVAVKQGRAAAGIRSAALMVDGTEAAVRETHGTIAFASVSALTAVLAARRDAAMRMAAISDALYSKLTDAAKQYDRTDEAIGTTLGNQLRDGQL